MSIDIAEQRMLWKSSSQIGDDFENPYIAYIEHDEIEDLATFLYELQKPVYSIFCMCNLQYQCLIISTCMVRDSDDVHSINIPV